jgi:Ca2+-binding RTX toxin-like protein
MAVFRFSALSDGQSLVFNPTADVLNFDQTTVAAADLRVTEVGTSIRVEVVSGPQTGKDVTLQNVSPLQLSITNVTFADGSRLLFGDTTSSTANDNLANSLTGTAGRDLLQGFDGADTMNGGAGNDTYLVRVGDVLSDTGGIDTVESSISWTLADGFENLTLTGIGLAGATGNNAANVLVGNSSGNFFNPRGGDDTIQAGGGNDLVRLGGGGVPSYGNKVIDGGTGIDQLEFGGFARSAIVVDLAAGTLKGGGDAGQGSATLISIENVVGDAFNDQISGSAVVESLNGGGGNDTLDGRGGGDTLTGGTGADTFVFATALGGGNVEQVTDFVSATDKLSFDNSVFPLGAAGNFAAADARFAAGAGLTSGQDANDRLIYNTTNGQLFYDADGNGPGASQLVAILQGAPALAASDILVTGQGQPNPGQATEGNDSLVGTESNDSINGLGGNDTIDGRGGNDTLDGGLGVDLLLGGGGNDLLVHKDLNDPGAVDTLDGGLGDDTYDLRIPGAPVNQSPVLVDAGGLETVLVDHDFTLPVGFENLTLFSPGFDDDQIAGTGNSSNNVITAGTSRNLIDGAEGDDTLIGGRMSDTFVFRAAASGDYGHDIIDGGGQDFEEGSGDVIVFDGARSGVVVDMRAGTATGSGISVTFTNIENATGSNFDDRLTAHDGVDVNLGGEHFVQGAALAGLEGNDTLDGGASGDTLVGGEGNDLLRAGDGNDSISFGDNYGNDIVDGGAGTDTINVFASSAVFIDLSAGILRGGGPGGTGGASLTSIENVVTGEEVVTDDVIIGNSVANRLESLLGYDTIRGGGGDDTITMFSVPDRAEAPGHAELFGEAGNDVVSREFIGQGNVLISGGTGNDGLSGQTGSPDTFLFAETPGSANADFIGRFADAFESGLDKIELDATAHINIGTAGNFAAGDARFAAGAGFTSGQDASDRVIYNTTTGQLFYDADGSGAGAAQLIATLQGAPELRATDIVVVGQGQPNSGQGTAGNDSLTGTAGDDLLQGLAGDDTLNGLAGNDTLDAGTGGDLLVGGTGNDTYIVDGPGDTVVENAGEGIDTVLSSATRTLDANVENLTLTGNAAINGTGNGIDNVITGNLASNALSGGAGNDTLLGRPQGLDPFDNPSDGDDSLDGGAGNDSLVGGAGFDLLVGGDGNDTLDGLFSRNGFNPGEAAVDTMNGGLGDDRYLVDNPNDVLSDAGGIDTVVAFDMDWTLGAGFENLTIANDFGEFGQTGIGNDLDNVMSVTFADSRLEGLGGNDTLRGTALFNGGEHGLNGGAGNDVLTGGGGGNSLFIFDQAPGTANADVISDFNSGSTLELDATVMSALGASGRFAAGDARFFAAAGASSGHDADDRIVFNTTTGQVFYDADGNGAGAGQLIVTLQPGASLTASQIVVDNGGTPGRTITGTAGNDSLSGTPGDDTLDGGAGIDTMNGGLGDDTYIVTAGDVLSDTGGVDTVSSNISWALADGFENLTLTGTGNISATGNNAANVLTGNSGNNFFNPRGGDDTIQAGAGNDLIRLGGGGVLTYGNKVIDGGAGVDQLEFGGFGRSAIAVDLAAGTLKGGGDGGQGTARLIGIESVVGDGFDDQISGSTVAESLNGGGGNDTMNGRGGNDTLTGGLGADTFVFDTPPSAGNVDQVNDFVSGTDKAALDDAVFTALGAAGNFAAGDARFAAGAGFTSGRDASDRIVYDTNTGNLYYDADGSGTGAAQLVATLQGHPTLAATDISVI